MKYFDWDPEKNKWLLENRGISFEACVIAFGEGRVFARENNNLSSSRQHKFIFNIDDYSYVVLYAEDDEKIFLKTMYPSRKETKKYLPDI